MKLNHKICIDFLELFKTGKFDFIKIGQSKKWILNNFPHPDDSQIGKTLETAQIWRYGIIEFYFVNDELSQIYTDYIDQISEGESIVFKNWNFNTPHKQSIQFVIDYLLEHKIDFQVKNTSRKYSSQISVLLMKGLVHLNFQDQSIEDVSNNEDHGKGFYKLSSFSIINEEMARDFYNTNLD